MFLQEQTNSQIIPTVNIIYKIEDDVKASEKDLVKNVNTQIDYEVNDEKKKEKSSIPCKNIF